MGKRGILLVATFVSIVLSGCATHAQTHAGGRSTDPDVRPSALPSDLVGTWNGSYWTVAAGPTEVSGNVTLVINEDGTYTLTEQRGASTRNHSGVVVANGRTITLRSSSGGWFPFRHRGDALYGVTHDRTSNYSLQMSVKKDSGALASPPSAGSGRP